MNDITHNSITIYGIEHVLVTEDCRNCSLKRLCNPKTCGYRNMVCIRLFGDAATGKAFRIAKQEGGEE